jgi:putative transposase
VKRQPRAIDLPSVDGDRYDVAVVRFLRKQLSHTKHLAARFGATYFITICTEPRGLNPLCHDKTKLVLFKTARIYREQQRWYLKLLMLMPDHAHALFNVSRDVSLSALIRDYKRATARISGIRWQRNFFDHRLGHNESATQKYDYIRQNPVRAGLIRQESDWPYFFGR